MDLAELLALAYVFSVNFYSNLKRDGALLHSVPQLKMKVERR